jgi:ADP-ribose pyrophosphatase YjhB (NUDIX family)
MTPERANLLAELLLEMRQEADGFIPGPAWLAVQSTFALPYVEVAIVRRAHDRKIQILLSHRADQHWRGWQIPGGLWRTPHTLEECIVSLTRTELGGQVLVSLLATGMWEKWHDHPYGSPISHVVLCAAENVRESSSIRWFSDVPEGMIDDHGHHARFIRSALVQAENLI